MILTNCTIHTPAQIFQEEVLGKDKYNKWIDILSNNIQHSRDNQNCQNISENKKTIVNGF